MDKHKLLNSDTLCDSWLVRFVISSTLAWLERGFRFPQIMFIVNIFEHIHIWIYSSVFFLSYRTLADFVKAIDCCFGTLAVTVKFVFEHTSSIKKRLCTTSDWVYRDYVQVVLLLFLNGMLAGLVKAIDCFGKQAVTVALPLAVFELISITALLGDFSLDGRIFSLLVVRFVTLWLSKTLN